MQLYILVHSDPAEEFSAQVTDYLNEMYKNDGIGINVY